MRGCREGCPLHCLHPVFLPALEASDGYAVFLSLSLCQVQPAEALRIDRILVKAPEYLSGFSPGVTLACQGPREKEAPVQSWRRNGPHSRLLRPRGSPAEPGSPLRKRRPFLSSDTPSVPTPRSSNYWQRRLRKDQLVPGTGPSAVPALTAAPAAPPPPPPAARLPLLAGRHSSCRSLAAWPPALAASQPPGDAPSGFPPTAVMDPVAWRKARA